MINALTMVGGIAALKDEAHVRATQEMNAKQKLWLYKQLDNLGIRY